MGRENFFSQFNKLPFFTKENLKISADRLSIPLVTLNSYVQRGLKQQNIISFKRNFYVTADFYESNKGFSFYTYFVGNKMVEPSYISRETALSYYGLLSEANTSVITLTTTKTTRRFSNRLGIFDYKNIKEGLFGGFNIVKKEFAVAIAEPHKAIFDYLYYRLPVASLRNKDEVLEAVEEYRLDIDDMDETELNKFFNLLKQL